MNLSDDTFLLSGHQGKIAPDPSPWLASTLRRVSTYWAERKKQSRDLRELYRFSDRELWDIGLSRSDIMSIDKGTYRRG